MHPDGGIKYRKPGELPSPEGSTPPKADKLENLIFATGLSVAFLLYGAYGLYRNSVLVPTRTGTQHLLGIEALVFYAVVLVAVPTNAIRLWEWHKHGNGDSEAYRIADWISKTAIYSYIAYCLLAIFGVGV